ncbi:iron only hydrogenase large subunit [Halobacteroides halobius DSM 5150]|uniref:Iron only hydrogenase large subunit n=1 Tax=Halobacteroides halobius (strain ATCC 35273 / DSM 5150 / MD-1) TaxID=748449 RepID=L0K8I2_HALHC|nr:[Fe-Fe] hydrogenase large subunit C-terminal domain-containing protein [Halobacteroides halobius]AGB40840.1 iron only hydrogenase large subunit [Halobacteroides halobius DSM 5150]
MLNRFKDFQKKRMEIFREIVKQGWDEKLSNYNLDELAKEIKEKYNYQDKDMTFIKDHIRVALGLDTKEDMNFSNEAQAALNHGQVKRPVVNKIEGACQYCGKEFETNDCYESCKYEAQMYKRTKGPIIVNDKCLSCGNCVSSCSFGAIADKIEFVPLLKLLKDETTPVYATVAPSIVGQFGDDITMGQLRTALKMLGFKDMIEVALFADMLTIKEAFEFNDLVNKQGDFFLTSCCCPVWIGLVENNYPQLFEHMSPALSPMVASGRVLKELYPEAKVVFIGPCIAKKSEAKEEEFREDIDFVLTFNELEEIFKAIDIDFNQLPGDEKDQASFAGRVYARTGGVSFSVKTVVNRIAPRRLIKFNAKKVDGVGKCKEILETLTQEEEIDANFIEGMGCEGGCVGGPRTNIEVDKATNMVNEYGEDSLIMTPFDNMNLIKILEELGADDIEEIAKDDKISSLLTR